MASSKRGWSGIRIGDQGPRGIIQPGELLLAGWLIFFGSGYQINRLFPDELESYSLRYMSRPVGYGFMVRATHIICDRPESWAEIFSPFQIYFFRVKKLTAARSRTAPKIATIKLHRLKPVTPPPPNMPTTAPPMAAPTIPTMMFIKQPC